jgi:hypothetical protein
MTAAGRGLWVAQLVLAALLAPVIPQLVVNLELGLVQPVARRGVV